MKYHIRALPLLSTQMTDMHHTQAEQGNITDSFLGRARTVGICPIDTQTVRRMSNGPAKMFSDVSQHAFWAVRWRLSSPSQTPLSDNQNVVYGYTRNSQTICTVIKLSSLNITWYSKTYVLGSFRQNAVKFFCYEVKCNTLHIYVSYHIELTEYAQVAHSCHSFNTRFKNAAALPHQIWTSLECHYELKLNK